MPPVPLDEEFIGLLACPVCKGPLRQRRDDRLDCDACGQGYPVRDDIPVLLVDEATPLTPPAGSPSDS